MNPLDLLSPKTKESTTKLGRIQVLSVSDYHIGVRRNDPKAMAAMFDKHVLNDSVLSTIDLMTIAGDFFDRALYFVEDAALEADKLIAKIFRACSRHGVVLRVLEGTPSHDAKQNNRFKVLFDILKPDVDFKLFEEVAIEHIDALNLDVLYVPDEAHPTTDKTKEVVEALMDAKGLKFVDLAVMHGFFEYQIPHGAKPGTFHDFEFYSGIVHHWITIGHVHTRSMLGKVLAQGSFDRISHGEEGAKGFVIASMRDPDLDAAWFIDNPDAHTYTTVNVCGVEPDLILEQLHSLCATLRAGSRVRIEAEKNNAIFSNFALLNETWPQIHFTKLPRATEDDEEIEKMLDETLKSYASLKIDKDTLRPLIEERLVNREIESSRVQRALSRLQECL